MAYYPTPLNTKGANKIEAEQSAISNRHRLFLNEMLRMCDSLSADLRGRCKPLLDPLAAALLDGTVFEIVKGLQDIQRMSEKNLFHSRFRKLQQLRANKELLVRKHQKELAQLNETGSKVSPAANQLQQRHRDEESAMERANRDSMKREDMRIVLELDQLAAQQQVTLEKAAVPGFFVSNKPCDQHLQMTLLAFVTQLANKFEHSIRAPT